MYHKWDNLAILQDAFKFHDTAFATSMSIEIIPLGFVFALPMSCGLQRFKIVFPFLLFDLLLIYRLGKFEAIDQKYLGTLTDVFWKIRRKVQLLNLPHCCWHKWKELQNYLPKYLHNFFLKKGWYILHIHKTHSGRFW
jgi:hypothetical protein